MRKESIVKGEYYHVFNRGNRQQDISHTDRDRVRLLASLLLLQSPVTIPNFNRVAHVRNSVSNMLTNVRAEILEQVVARRYVALVSFALMPNHLHCIVHERSSNGIAQYMKRVLGGYTKYINTRYERSGHVFQGPFHAVHIEDDDQLCYLSAYIHRNPRDLAQWRGREHEYPWSSFQDFIGENRWGALLQPQVITDQVGRGERYRRFVERSRAKVNLMDRSIRID